MSLTISTTVTWQTAVIRTDNVVFPTISLVNGTLFLSEACFCIERTAQLNFKASSDFQACNYPFTTSSHIYAATSSFSSMRLTFRSGTSPYVTMLQRFGRGDLNNVRDAEVLTSSTPLALIGIGIAIFFVGLLALVTFCCCISNPVEQAVKPQPV